MDSEAAEEILRGANIPDDVIAGVRALTKGQSVMDQVKISSYDSNNYNNYGCVAMMIIIIMMMIVMTIICSNDNDDDDNNGNNNNNHDNDDNDV